MFPVLICWTYDYDEWIKFCLNQRERHAHLTNFVGTHWLLQQWSFTNCCRQKCSLAYLIAIIILIVATIKLLNMSWKQEINVDLPYFIQHIDHHHNKARNFVLLERQIKQCKLSHFIAMHKSQQQPSCLIICHGKERSMPICHVLLQCINCLRHKVS